MTRCRVCRRPLTTAESQTAGIGPTCRQHRATVAQALGGSQLEFEGLRPEGERDGQMDVALALGTGKLVVVLQAEPSAMDDAGRETRDDLVAVLGDRTEGEVIRWPLGSDPIRAPWWRRLWLWVRGGVR